MIVGKPFADGLWKSGGSAGQGKMVFLRGGKVGMDIGWVGYFACDKQVNDGKWHEVALKFVKEEGSQYQIFVDNMETPCSKGLHPVLDNPDTSIVIGKSIGHSVSNGVANGDMAPDMVGEIVDVSYANTIPKSEWDLSGGTDFVLQAKFKTTEAGGTIVGKPFADGLWKSGGSAGQGKMVFLRGGKVGMDIGWVGYFACDKKVNDGNWHEVALTFVKGEGTQYQLFVDDMETPCSKGLHPVLDHPDLSVVIGKSIGHSVSNGVANGDMAPDMVGEIVDVSYANTIPKSEWDLSGGTDFVLQAKFKTTEAGGTIVGKPFADGLWKSGGSAGQGKMVFLRGGKVGMDIGWVGYFACDKQVNDGNW